MSARSRASSAHTDSTASRPHPPVNTESLANSRRSSSNNRSWLQSTTARSVWWRGNAVRLPPVSTRNRSSSRPTSCVSGSTRSRAAASSKASGR